MPIRRALCASLAGPWGPVHVAATERGIVAVGWLTTEAAFEADLARRLDGSVDEASDDPVDEASDDPADDAADDRTRRHLGGAIAALGDLFAGRPMHATVRFDLSDRAPWDQRVLTAVAGIPWGSTASYGEIARRIGSPGAARAVGGAVGRNPVSLLIPCHRVIAADGTIGGYGGDGWGGGREERLDIKRDLLAREGVAIAPVRTAGWGASGRRR